MPGFFVSNFIDSACLQDSNEFSYSEKALCFDGFFIKHKVVDKFIDDKILQYDDDFLAVTDGVVLNKRELLEENKSCSLFELLKKLKDTSFETNLRGCFSGGFFDKNKHRWHFYTNHFGDKPIFYYHQEDKWIVASSPIYIIDSLRKNGISVSLDKNALYNLASYGFMINDETLCKEIKRLRAGTTISIENNHFIFKRYFIFDNSFINNDSYEQTLEKLNNLFIKAVKLEYDKDEENGYKHFSFLSGGRDSRMAIWVASNVLKNKNITAACFSQINTLDQKISQSIAKDLQIGYIFKGLNDAEFLYDLEESIYLNYGLCCSSGQVHLNSMIKSVNLSEYGLLHTGQISDSLYNSRTTQFNPHNFANSTFLIEKTNNDMSYFNNKTVFKNLTRSYNGILCSSFFMDSSSPFLDIDYLNYKLSIPESFFAKKRGIFNEWIIKKHPGAARYKWEKTNSKISSCKFIIRLNEIRKYGIKFSLNYLFSKIGIKHKFKVTLQNEMNPYDFWDESNENIRSFMDTYFKTEIRNPIFEKEIKDDLELMYVNCSAREKYQVLTVLASVKRYFN